MDALLRPVKTTRNVKSRIEEFETLKSTPSLNPSSKPQVIENKKSVIGGQDSPTPLSQAQIIQTEKPSAQAEPATNRPLHQVKRSNKRDSTAFLQHTYLEDDRPPQISGASLTDDACEILKSQPDQEDLVAVLAYLQYGIDGKHDFNIRTTSPKSAQILNVLVTATVLDIWPNLEQPELSPQEAQLKQTIVSCLSCAAGFGALVAQIRQSIHGASSGVSSLRVLHLLKALSKVLNGHSVVLRLLSDTQTLYKDDNHRRLFWQETIAFLAGGRILSIAAEAIAAMKTLESGMIKRVEWLGDGKQYTRWLAKNVVTASLKLPSADKHAWESLGLLMKRALTLGHKETFVNEIYSSFLLGSKALWTPLHQLLTALSDHDQKLVFDTILLDLSIKCFGGTSALGFSDDPPVKKAISAYAALVSGLIKANQTLQEHLEEWLVVANATYATIGLASRRALIAVLASSADILERILTRSLTNFADKLQIQHTLSMQQDAQAQTILLAIGHLKRNAPDILKRPHISSSLMRSVSNRLGASFPRSRFLGMVVGTAYSTAVDAPGQVLDFGVEEMETDEARSWLNLLDIQDNIADKIDARELFLTNPQSISTVKSRRRSPREKIATPVVPQSKIISIEEMTDSESEDEDLVPYGKPDSDAEDSDEDPTLINRSKPSAPVYIIDLIKQLQTNDKPDVIELALKTAPALIRRKIGFGTELSDNLSTLATELVNLQEGVNEPHLATLRLQSLIACVIAKPDTIAPSLATLYFEGDLSISQRVVLLTAIGLSARELAGFKDTTTTQEAPASQDTSFPSKRLPAHLQPSSSPNPAAKQSSTTSQQQNPISTLTLAEAQSTIRPMALAAADKMTGPSVLKIRTFSSRMNVEKKRDAKAQARTKMIPKNLHTLLVTSFYLPLCCRMSLVLTAGSTFSIAGGGPNTTILLPSLTRMLLQTLTLVLHTLGPSASLHLPTLTHESLALLVALHAASSLATDPLVLPALLHLLLALMDVTVEAGYHAQERLITDHGAQVAELVGWANALGDKIAVPDLNDENNGGGYDGSGGGSGGGMMPWSILAAGIQVKWFEMGKRFQGRMLGLAGVME